MRRILLPVFLIVSLFCLTYALMGNFTVEAAKQAEASCQSCHADFASVLPKGHSPVSGTSLASCVPCHQSDFEGKSEKNAFSTRMHLAHLPPKGAQDCEACHAWTAGKSFGLIGQKGSWGAPDKNDMDLMRTIFKSWAGSGYMDNLHATQGIGCAQCHGKGLPKADDTVENSRCLVCHGPLDKLAQKTEPKEFKDRNPHKSHLGSDIACTVCHKGHAESKVYCLECHKFDMKIKGAAQVK
ncbi:MAG: Fumarate reductase flavoprotein subunit precursor [Syntrophus sp. PtaU1.Bin208]|nr:MAG: Fumarate reductase flavoprotein subunit precursor [Syntrophus sp. PtaU1.Bin208]